MAWIMFDAKSRNTNNNMLMFDRQHEKGAFLYQVNDYVVSSNCDAKTLTVPKPKSISYFMYFVNLIRCVDLAFFFYFHIFCIIFTKSICILFCIRRIQFISSQSIFIRFIFRMHNILFIFFFFQNGMQTERRIVSIQRQSSFFGLTYLRIK